MHAFPLSQDHPKGSDTSAAGSVQKSLMEKLPTGNAIKKKEEKYVKGHLLNANLGGPAQEANLFPITDRANSQHFNNVETFIRSAVDEGYVYEYRLEVKDISTGSVPGSQSLFWVNSKLDLDFGRLDVSKKVIPGTRHHAVATSHYGEDTATEFGGTSAQSTTAQSTTAPTRNPKLSKADFRKIKKAEFIVDFKDGRASKPQDPKGASKPAELIGTNPGAATTKAEVPVDQAEELDSSEEFSREPLEGTNFPSIAPQSTTVGASTSQPSTPQSLKQVTTFKPRDVVNSGPAKISLVKSKTKDVVAYLTGLVNGWDGQHIEDWLDALRASKSLRKWDDIMKTKAPPNLDPQVASDLIKKLRSTAGVSIAGAAR